MATHGYIKVKNGDGDQILEAMHDGYIDRMVSDIFSLPIWLYNKIKHDERINYKFNLFKKEKNFKDFASFMNSWNSLIPLESTEYLFRSYMVALDPFMYISRDDKYSNVTCEISIDFTEADMRRLPHCKITIESKHEDDLFLDKIKTFDGEVENINSGIYHENSKIKKFNQSNKEISYLMNIDFIVADLIYQDITDHIKRDRRIQNVLN